MRPGQVEQFPVHVEEVAFHLETTLFEQMSQAGLIRLHVRTEPDRFPGVMLIPPGKRPLLLPGQERTSDALVPVGRMDSAEQEDLRGTGPRFVDIPPEGRHAAIGVPAPHGIALRDRLVGSADHPVDSRQH